MKDQEKSKEQLINELVEMRQQVSKLEAIKVENEHTREALRRSEDKFSKIFHASPIAIVLTSIKDGRYIAVNDAFLRDTEFSRENVIGSTAIELGIWMNSEGRAEFLQTFEEQGFVHNMEYPYRKKTGGIGVALLSTETIDIDGEPCFITLLRDITERNQTRAAFAEEHNKLTALYNNLPAYIYIKDTESRYIISNNSHLQSMGKKTVDEVIGKTDFELFPPELAQEFYADEQKIFQTEQPMINREELSLNAEGAEMWALTTKVPFHNQDGEIAGIVGITQNITGRKQAERQALQLALEEERSKLLSQFVQDAAHEFKTPLSTITSRAYTLLKSSDKKKRQKSYNIIVEHVRVITQLVDYMLLTIRLNMETEVSREYSNLNQIVESSLIALQSDIQNKSHDLHVELDEQLQAVRVDADNILIAINKILKNAIKFTPPGGLITVSSRLEKDEIILEIRDTGIGMTPEVVNHIFDLFYKGNEARTERGFGLGLAIALRIISLHDGKIEVESNVDKGSLFRIKLPAFNS